jgi:hypothetical protein
VPRVGVERTGENAANSQNGAEGGAKGGPRQCDFEPSGGIADARLRLRKPTFWLACLARVEKDADGAEAIKREAAEYLRVLRNAQTTNVKDSRELAAEIRATQLKHDQAVTKIELARVASFNRGALRQVFPALLGAERQAQVIDWLPLPPAVHNEMVRLGLKTNCAEPWQDAAPMQRKAISISDSFKS